MFKQDFKSYVCEGDRITCEVDGLTCIATLHDDTDSGRPDQMQDGFWPSLDPADAGYIGPKSKQTLARHQARAADTMAAWERGLWSYFGVTVTVEKDDVRLTGDYSHALWGIEGNFPPRRRNQNTNRYFRDVANGLLDEALAAAKAKLESLCDCEKETA